MKASLLPGRERRKTTRTTIEAITYINFDSENGAILSNISEGGLCFHAALPVQQTEGFRVWFSARGHRIEADVELVWTDETRKTGGFRFISPSPEIDEQIRRICRPTGLAAAQGKSLPSVPKPQVFRALSGSRSDRAAAPDVRPLLQKSPPPRNAAATGFFRGLLTGLLIATLVGAALLFNSYRRQFGGLLIQLGERFGAKPAVQAVSPPPPTPPPVP